MGDTCPLDYACDWASGNNTEENICSAILENGFREHYTYSSYGNCGLLASDFVRLATSLGISASLHVWASIGDGVDNMVMQKTIDEVIAVGSEVEDWYTFDYHVWAQTGSYQRNDSQPCHPHAHGK